MSLIILRKMNKAILPIVKPKYTTEPKSPRDELSKFKSSFNFVVAAGITPWSIFISKLIINIIANTNTSIENRMFRFLYNGTPEDNSLRKN